MTGKSVRPRTQPESLPIRRARASDVAALLTMMEPLNRGEHIVWRPRAVEAALRRLLRERRLGVVLVAERAGKSVAYAVATFGFDLEFAGPDAFVTELFVEVEHRRSGIARRLLLETIAQLEAQGAGAVHLLVRPANRAARQLYEKLGFKRVPRLVMTRVGRSGRTRS